MQLLTFTHTLATIPIMRTELASGKYDCKRGNSSVIVGITDKDSVVSMLQVCSTASLARNYCHALRGSECQENCRLEQLVAQVVGNLNELI